MVNKLKVLFIIACLGLTGIWPNTGRIYSGSSPATPPYVGPGDVVGSAILWYGLRAYNNTLANSGTSTTPALDVRGNSTATSCTIYLKGDGTGGIDLTTSGAGGVGHACASGATTFCTVTNTSCTVSKLYDQTAANNCVGPATCDATQATVANQPTLTFSCIGSLPCLTAAGSQAVGGANRVSQTQPVTIVAETERTGNFTTSMFVHGEWDGNAIGIFFTTATNTIEIYGGTHSATATAADSTLHNLQAVLNGASSIAVVDGSATTGLNAGTTGFNQHPGVMGIFNISQTLTGIWTESGEWPIAFNSTQYAAMSANMAAYW